MHPNCNTIHWNALAYDTIIISCGYHRDALEHCTSENYYTDNITIKTFRHKNQDANKDLMGGIIIDVLMIEKLTFSELATLNECSLGYMGFVMSIVTIR